MSLQMFAAHNRFDSSCGESWTRYIEWSGFRHISELVSTDTMLCPSVIDELIEADWAYNIHADFKTYMFHDFTYLKRRIQYDPKRHIYSVTHRTSHFAHCGCSRLRIMRLRHPRFGRFRQCLDELRRLSGHFCDIRCQPIRLGGRHYSGSRDCGCNPRSRAG
jgi:hypothetical protein